MLPLLTNVERSRDENGLGYYSLVKTLVDTLDSYIPDPERDIDHPFLMPIEDVFSISGRGTVVTGRVERGVIRVGEEVEIVGIKAYHQDHLYWR